jgi:drug/metabolite transporter (DMT)-like permease
VFTTAVAFTIQLWAQQYTTPSHAAILFTLEPVVAVITSYILIHERLGKRSIVGGVFVFAGILIAELLGPPAARNRLSLSSRGVFIFSCGGRVSGRWSNT